MTLPPLTLECELASYHCSADGLMRPEFWLLFCQEIAEKHAHEHGFGSSWAHEKGYLWVQTKSDFILHRCPRWKEIVRLETNTGTESAVQAQRRVSMYSQEGELLAEAKLNWVLIDAVRRRPISLKRAALEIAPLNEPWQEASPPADWEDSPAQLSSLLTTRRDIDFNGHINNSAYLIWALDLMGRDTAPKRILLQFRKESHAGELLELSYQEQGRWTRCLVDDRAELFCEW